MLAFAIHLGLVKRVLAEAEMQTFDGLMWESSKALLGDSLLQVELRDSRHTGHRL